MTPSEELMKTVVEAWGKADMRPFYDALHDDIVWKSAAAVWDDRMRFGGAHEGRANVIALLSKLATWYFNAGCKAKEIISSGEVVWGLFDVAGSYAPVDGGPPKVLNLEMAFRWRVRDGKILEAQTFFDTARLLVQTGRAQ
jgi:ketosteroid isomerase-like protein